jgi:hypothetical protein
MRESHQSQEQMDLFLLLNRLLSQGFSFPSQELLTLAQPYTA